MELQAKKSLGQHFLNSPGVLAKIVDAAKLTPGETVLEIGPGTGVLTRALLDAGANVIAVEKDTRAYGLLMEKFGAELVDKRLTLYLGDILESDRASYGLVENKYALVANIPYYITGAILESFLEHEPRPNRMVLLVQKEVAERIVAADNKESILSVSVKAFGVPRMIAKVPRGAFTPPPTVDSAILSVENISGKNFKGKNSGEDIDIKKFFKIVRAGFAHKRKYVKRNLEDALAKTEIDKIWTKNKLDEKLRAEDVILEEWFGIARG